MFLSHVLPSVGVLWVRGRKLGQVFLPWHPPPLWGIVLVPASGKPKPFFFFFSEVKSLFLCVFFAIPLFYMGICPLIDDGMTDHLTGLHQLKWYYFLSKSPEGNKCQDATMFKLCGICILGTVFQSGGAGGCFIFVFNFNCP